MDGVDKEADTVLEITSDLSEDDVDELITELMTKENMKCALEAERVRLQLFDKEYVREAREVFKQSDVYKQKRSERNAKAKVKEKAKRAERKADAERRERGRLEKVEAEKRAKLQRSADHCIQNGIKYAVDLWVSGDRKGARKRLGVAKQKHFHNASLSMQQRSREQCAEWDVIEAAEREAARPPPPQFATIAIDTSNMPSEPSPPAEQRRESASQRNTLRRREKAAAEVKLKAALLKFVLARRALAALRCEQERVERAYQEACEARLHDEVRFRAEQQIIFDEIQSRASTERANRAIARQCNADFECRVAAADKGKGTENAGPGGRGGCGGRGGRGRGGRGGRGKMKLVPVCEVRKIKEGPVAPPFPVDDDDVCIICMEHARTHLTVPCGHMKFCGECVANKLKDVSRCPECNTFLNLQCKFVKVHM